MREFSRTSSAFRPEHGIDIARWPMPTAAPVAPPFAAMWCVVPPSSASRPDAHPEVELAVVVQGRGTFQVDGDRLDVAPGSAVLFEPAERHVIHNGSDDEQLVVLSVYWMPSDGAS
ncbi:cupin domain-containing protein [Micromonospora rosaria]|nr:cupin domain-containing protein [Micromonospora rosaria]